ncbi:integral membrane protein [Aspergillus cavernicola]|uniref:Integral membrane protein n=1 Tax=Aspergillus cavernicola TaxID=176166 RepID=A0ABR4HVX3_9EURO
MSISHHPGLHVAANGFALIAIGFGVNALLRPDHALTFFEWEPPTSLADKQLVNSLVHIYGVRDLFMGLAVYIASAYGTRHSLGLTLAAVSAVAYADGYVCYTWGKGEWGHWSYAPLLTALAATLLGVFDRA